MDVVGSEIGQKMRSAIKAKLTELGCYVDDELPDYVMVMVANKRTRAQMEDDLQLFLGDNTELFVNWLHQVLKKLQEVTVAAPLKTDTKKDKSESKEIKSKDKTKKSDSKKSKKKDKAKEKARKKEDKKNHKSKKKSKHEMIRPNIPPLLMNIEKDSEPSITDVFAGQILKNHGVLLETYKETTNDSKVEIKEPVRQVVPIIDLETITQPEVTPEVSVKANDTSNMTNEAMKEEHKIEMTQIETKIQGLKKKLVEQLDSMSDDEDFLNIRTEAEELMNDFAEDVFQEISQPTPHTPPLRCKSPTPPKPELPPKPIEPKEMETLPHIELNLPKRPIRERLGAREIPKPVETKELETKKPESPERFTPEKEPKMKLQTKSARSRLGSHSEPKKVSVSQDSSELPESTTKRVNSKVSVDSRARSCASVVRVRPRLRAPAPASSLLLRAVADAHKSLLNIPPKIDTESHKVKRALVLPMRRAVEAKKIVIQVPVDTQSDSQGDTISLGEDIDLEDKSSKTSNDVIDKETFKPHSITKVIKNTEYIPAAPSICDDDTIMDTINIHNPTVDKDKDTQFIVTMDGYHPNAFLAKKLLTEELLDEKNKETNESPEDQSEKEVSENSVAVRTATNKPVIEKEEEITHKKRLSNTSDESNTQVIIKREEKIQEEIKKCNEIIDKKQVEKRKGDVDHVTKSPPVKKRRASPIVFDVDKKKEKAPERIRERTVSASSDSHVTLSTTASAHKFDSVPPLSTAERKTVWCRTFPLCRYGSSCAFAHPRCKFAAACTRRGCVYSHAPNALSAPGTPSPIVASHVVPAANYKTISSVTLPSMCKFYPNCVNPACHYYHPKPCRYGKACANKIECNFYHNDVPSKFKYSV